MNEDLKNAINGLTNNHVGRHLLSNLRATISKNYDPSNPEDTDNLETALINFLENNPDTSNIGETYFNDEMRVGNNNLFSLVKNISKKFPGSKNSMISARAKYACDNTFSPRNTFSLPHIVGIDNANLFGKNYDSFCNDFWFQEQKLEAFLEDQDFEKYFPAVDNCSKCGASGELISKFNRVTFQDSFIDFIEFRTKAHGSLFDKITDVLCYDIGENDYSLRNLDDVYGVKVVLKSIPKKSTFHKTKQKNKNKKAVNTAPKKYVLSTQDERLVSYMTPSQVVEAKKFVEITLFSKGKISQNNSCFLKGRGIPVKDDDSLENNLCYATLAHIYNHIDSKSIPKVGNGLDNYIANPRLRKDVLKNVFDNFKVISSTARYNGKPFEIFIENSEDYVKENTKGKNPSPIAHKPYEVRREFAKRDRWTYAHDLVSNTVNKLFKGENYD